MRIFILNGVLVERPAEGTAVVVFTGEHDLSTAYRVRHLLASVIRRDDLIVADFSSATFIDSSIRRVLLDAHAQAHELGKVLRLQLGTADIVRRAFEISGVLAVIELFLTREDALVRDEVVASFSNFLGGATAASRA